MKIVRVLCLIGFTVTSSVTLPAQQTPSRGIIKGLTITAAAAVAMYGLYRLCAKPATDTQAAKKTSRAKQEIQQLALVKPCLSASAIEAMKKTMDDIETRGLDYDDYSKRRGHIWSDVLVRTENPEIVEEFDTAKATQVDGALKTHKPLSIRQYAAAEAIVCKQILPKFFEAIKKWDPSLPPSVYAQIFLQRCNTSEAMDWHQDPGEDYDPQANYSLVLMLSKKKDPQHGWQGGEFRIKRGLPTAPHQQEDVRVVKHRFNQAIIFNNQANSHSVTAVTSPTQKTKRDIVVVTINTKQLPKKKA